ncbi:MAG: GNAT family N-acetyltransferase [Planctomycetota bacterium]|nr:GNAT family N-acetyltransferase [Planctomycetota bacterium]MDA1212104.1 GNAT family N-acetyltransferase [Planctomycetota bacterium]
MKTLTCREITDLQTGDPLWTQWKILQTRVASELSIFGPEWFSIWNQTHGATGRWSGRLRLLTVTDANGMLRGLTVLSEQKHAGIGIKASAGYFQPWRGILADLEFESEVGQAIGEFVARGKWLLCQIGPFRQSSVATQSFIASLKSHNAAVVTKSSAQLAVCHSPDTWDAYKKDILGGKFFRKTGNYERRMNREGRTEIEHLRRPNREQTKKLIDDLSHIEQHSWLMTSKRGKTRFTKPVAQRFWSRLIDDVLSPQDQIDAWVIHFDGRPVSFCLTLTSLPARYVIANQFDEQVAEYRTGSTLYRMMVEEGIERGVRTFDFGDGGIEYKKLWGAEYVDTVDTLLVASHPLTSRILPLAYSARQWLQSRRSLKSYGGIASETIKPQPNALTASTFGTESTELSRPTIEDSLLESANELIELCHSVREQSSRIAEKCASGK